MQVVIQDPVGGGGAVVFAVGVARLAGGVGAEQVVEGVPAGGVLGDQAVAGKFAQEAAGFGLLGGGQARSGGDAGVRAAVQAQ
jgi:hypothetical protein